MKILVFSWNTQSIGIYESDEDAILESNRNTIFNTWSKLGYKPDFASNLEIFIDSYDPDLIVIGFQEDCYPGSYFHSYFLPIFLKNYTNIFYQSMLGIGITTVKALTHFQLLTRGLQMSIYGKPSLKITNVQSQEYPLNYMRSKGGLAIYLTFENMGTIAFIDCHLPFNANSLIEARNKNNPMIRQNSLVSVNLAFNNILENLVLEKEVDHYFLFGDLNYRIDHHGSAREFAEGITKINLREIYEQKDELKKQMDKDNIYKMFEGIANSGPEFYPTCKMDKNRTDRFTWKTGKFDQRIPSWCDRILNSKDIKCLYYNSFCHGNIMKSDHDAVIGIYEI